MMMRRKNELIFAALWAATLLMGWRPLSTTFLLAAREDEYTYILLILPISAVLMFLERSQARTTVGWNLRFAPILLGIALATVGGTAAFSATLPSDAKLSLYMLALVLSWIGIFVLCFGSAASRTVAFPLLFLLGLIPFPQSFLGGVIALLQEGSAWCAHALFAACGVPVVQEGVFLTIPGLTIQVAQECSSIRSSSMLLVTTIVLVQILLRSPWRKALVVGLAIPLSIAKNGLRIFTIAMLGTKADPGYLTGRLHRQGGIVFFIIALLGIFAALAICQKAENAALKTG
jgi:exosortase